MLAFSIPANCVRFLVPDTVRFQTATDGSVAGEFLQLHPDKRVGDTAVDDLLHHVGVHLCADSHDQSEFGAFAVRSGVRVQFELVQLCVLDRYQRRVYVR